MDELKEEFGRNVYQLLTHPDFQMLTRATPIPEDPPYQWRIVFYEDSVWGPNENTSRRTILGGNTLVEVVRRAQEWTGSLHYHQHASVTSDTARRLATILTHVPFKEVVRWSSRSPLLTDSSLPSAPLLYRYRFEIEEHAGYRWSTRIVEGDNFDSVIEQTSRYMPMTNQPMGRAL